jgi:hypothetical protein
MTLGGPLLLSKDRSGILPRLDHTAGASEPYLETRLQKLVDEHPGVLPVRDFLPLATNVYSLGREIEVSIGESSGIIDNLLVTDDAHVVIVETKLWRNPQSLREVIAQTLQYGMAISRMTSRDFETRLRGTKGSRLGADETLFQYLQNLSSSVDDEFMSEFDRRRTKSEILLLIVADRIRANAEQLVEWMNRVCSLPFKLGLIELGLYKLPDGDLVVPKALLRIREGERHVVQVSISDQARDVVSVTVNEAGKVPSKVPAGPIKDRDITEEVFTERLSSYQYTPETLELIDKLRARFSSSGLAVRFTPSEIIYGIQVDGDFLSLVHLAPNVLYIIIPIRVARVMGPERFEACKKKLNSVAPFYRSVLGDDSKVTMQKYGAFVGKLDVFMESVMDTATQMREAMSEAYV